MMEGKDFFSLIVGFIVLALGAVPLLEGMKVFNLGLTKILSGVLAANIAVYLVAGLGLYLAIESIIEITNSNSIGGFSLIIALLVTVLGLIPILSNFGILPFNLPFALSQMVFQIIFIIEGLFLIIAGFAMEM